MCNVEMRNKFSALEVDEEDEEAEEKKKKGGIGVTAKGKEADQQPSAASKVTSRPTASELLAVKLRMKEKAILQPCLKRQQIQRVVAAVSVALQNHLSRTGMKRTLTGVR